MAEGDEVVRVRAKFDYQSSGQVFATGDQELSFRAGQDFTFVVNLGNGWVRVADPATGLTGLVAASYVERVFDPAVASLATGVAETSPVAGGMSVSAEEAAGVEEDITEEVTYAPFSALTAEASTQDIDTGGEGDGGDVVTYAPFSAMALAAGADDTGGEGDEGEEVTYAPFSGFVEPGGASGSFQAGVVPSGVPKLASSVPKRGLGVAPKRGLAPFPKRGPEVPPKRGAAVSPKRSPGLSPKRGLGPGGPKGPIAKLGAGVRVSTGSIPTRVGPKTPIPRPNSMEGIERGGTIGPSSVSRPKRSPAKSPATVSGATGAQMAAELDIPTRGMTGTMRERTGTVLKDMFTMATCGAQVGKSALCVRFCYGDFKDVDEPTVEDNHKAEFMCEGIQTEMKILDTSGADDYKSFHGDWFKQSRAQGIMFVFSVANRTSLQMLPDFYNGVARARGSDEFPCVLVGTCADMTRRQVKKKDALAMARKFNCPYVEVSAKTGENVETGFGELVKEMRYGKKKDPFVQEYPYYGAKPDWKEILQDPPVKLLAGTQNPMPLCGNESGQLVGWTIEQNTSPCVNYYVFPKNLDTEEAPAGRTKKEKKIKSAIEEDPHAGTRVFGESIETCMMKQRDSHPDLPVPRAIVQLMATIISMECGTKGVHRIDEAHFSEGIFRVPGIATSITAIRDSIDSGDYNVLAMTNNVHDVTGALKLFFREMPYPLIPVTEYETCVKTPQLCKKVFSSMSDLAQRVTRVLFEFLTLMSRDSIMEETKMGRDNLAMVFVPSLLRCPYTDPSQILASADKEKLFVTMLWDQLQSEQVPPLRVELPLSEHLQLLEREEKYIPYFGEYFLPEKEHVDFMGWVVAGAEDPSPCVISVANKAEMAQYRTLIVTKNDTYRLFVPAVVKDKELMDLIPKIAQTQLGFAIKKLVKVKNGKKFVKDMDVFEKTQNANEYKWGVLWQRPGQTTEDQWYANRHEEASPAYLEFLDFLGDKIVLKDWQHYRGGLNVKTGDTGTHSYYTKFTDQEFEIMFHVASLLPYFEKDSQQLERKRHLGNDIVIIVFREPGTEIPFDPSVIRSEFNHIFLIVEPISVQSEPHYRVSLAIKDGTPPFGPPLQTPGIFRKGPEFRELLLTKLVNAERASLHGCPAFKNKTGFTRKAMLENLSKTFGKKFK